MSFSSTVKSELCRVQGLDECCLTAEIYGIILFGTTFSTREVRIVSHNASVLKRVPFLCGKVFGIDPEKDIRTNRQSLLISSRTVLEKIYQVFGQPYKEGPIHINRAVVDNECCRISFLRGAFLTGGWVSEPDKKSHLEIETSYTLRANELMSLMLDSGFRPGITERRNRHIIYLKGSENIEDFLTTIGAMHSAMSLMEAKVEKDLRNHINRKVNCEYANMTKSMNAGWKQIEAIRTIDDMIGLDKIDEDLQLTAKIRLENPNASLTELAALFPYEISKPGLSHRLKKIMSIAENSKEIKEK